MDVGNSYHHLKKIKPVLVFFCFLGMLSCRQEKAEKEVRVNYVEGKAVSVSLITEADVMSYDIFIKGNSQTPVLGSFDAHTGPNGNELTFMPVIPFSEGQSYLLSIGKEAAMEFSIEKKSIGERPKILAIYPTRDTVPENLLKIYIEFSEPMQQVGNALDFIKVINQTENKEESIFLELQPELWNKEHTRLTLWLDPGRIKKDLIPNKEKGIPIKKGNHYLLEIDSTWRSAEGVSLDADYTKELQVGDRDKHRPTVGEWQVKNPIKGSKTPVFIDFRESLDAILAKEAIAIMDSNNAEIQGTYALMNHEAGLVFYPTEAWEAGDYVIEVGDFLEDLAGNNLDHLFDTDLEETSNTKKSTTNRISFTIEL